MVVLTVTVNAAVDRTVLVENFEKGINSVEIKKDFYVESLKVN